MNLDVVWDDANSRGDWSVVGGRLSTGNLLVTAVLLSMFTDRVAQPDYVPLDGSGDRRGWWHDTLDGVPIGSRLWQLRRRKIANRSLLINDATDILREALQWLINAGIAASIGIQVTSAQAGLGSSGNQLRFTVQIFQPNGQAPIVRALWRAT